jgi:DNA-directed RNA polymerase, mitochondrial
MGLFDLEINLTKERLEDGAARGKRAEELTTWKKGYQHTHAGRAITETYLPRLIAAVPDAIQRCHKAKSILQGLAPRLEKLKPETIALCALQGALRSIGFKETWGDTCRTMGHALSDELFAHGFAAYNKKRAKEVAEEVVRRYSGSDKRSRAARVEAAKAGYCEADWPADHATYGGHALMILLLHALPDVFTLTGGGEFKKLSLTNEGRKVAADAIEHQINHNPVLLPMVTEPAPWTTKRLRQFNRALRRVSIVRSRKPAHAKAFDAALQNGTMQTALNGLNALQSVPWTINQRILSVIEGCIENKIEVDGLPGVIDPLGDFPNKGALSAEEWTKATHNYYARRALHEAATSQEIALLFVRKVANELAKHERWWTPMNFDFRGRVYATTMFNYQREDVVRALFLFADGEPVESEGLYWLKTAVANNWAGAVGDGFDEDGRIAAQAKTDKIPLPDRARWTDMHMEQIEACSAYPLKELWWTKSDNPFLFLASCMELVSALRDPNHVCRLPISFDGSCSGLQHYCMMTRAPEGHLVNLIPNDQPSDVYEAPVATVMDVVRKDAATTEWPEGEEWRGDVAKLWEAFGVTRKVTKRNVMTWSYSATRRGIRRQQQEDLMDDLRKEVLIGKRAEHPFGDYANGRAKAPGKAAVYIGDLIYPVIESIVPHAADAKRFLRAVARVCAKADLPVTWITPVGLPWVNEYRKPNVQTIFLWLQGKEERTSVTVGDTQDIQEGKVRSAIAPNFVHACDASHLLLTAIACKATGVSLATVHDSFGCMPGRAPQLRRILLETLVRMYEEHDVLAEILARAQEALKDHPDLLAELPPLPAKGSLNLKEVLNAEYAFA